MAERRGQPNGAGGHSSDRGSIPEVVDSAVVEDPPSPDPKRLHLEISKKSMDFILRGRDVGGH